jgi:ribulose-phosphate 3-epimerase|tara:strand:- start:105 stop:782 length:678 start_codon:yes stop_codon:yes gene_type:complete
MTSLKISASLLASDFTKLGSDIREIESSEASELHFDVMDGHFVPNITIGIPILESIRPITKLPIDLHMMVVNPENHVEAFSKAGGNIFTFHVEGCENILKTINSIRKTSMSVGISIKPETPVEMIYDFIDYVDRILVMTVQPGFGGQQFLPETLPKIKKIAELISKNKRHIDLAVDGGIKKGTVELAIKAGATTLISGTGLFGHENGVGAGISDFFQYIESSKSN